jgi:hypothetical protein
MGPLRARPEGIGASLRQQLSAVTRLTCTRAGYSTIRLIEPARTRFRIHTRTDQRRDTLVG